jgi:hypothetical protein
VDICRKTIPIHNITVGIPLGGAFALKSSIRVVGRAEPMDRVVRSPAIEGILPGFNCRRRVIWVHEMKPAVRYQIIDA